MPLKVYFIIEATQCILMSDCRNHYKRVSAMFVRALRIVIKPPEPQQQHTICSQGSRLVELVVRCVHRRGTGALAAMTDHHAPGAARVITTTESTTQVAASVRQVLQVCPN